MSKAVMISIRPKWCEKILSGEKTIEVRKNCPKLGTPFKAYIYCTKGRPDLNIPISLERLMQDYLNTGSMKSLNCPHGNGKVIGEFTCDRITRVNICGFWDDYGKQLDNRLKKTCLTLEEFCDYLGEKVGYGWHISNLKIYDTPKELIEFHTWKKCKSCSKSGYESTACIYDENCMIPAAITKAPQSWCYVEEG